MSKTLLDPNFPLSEDGKTMHLEVGPGDVNPRILSVGDAGRGQRVSGLLENCRVIKANRGFVTYSGSFEGVPVSVIVTGMGIPMMDFVVREATHVITGKVAIIRLGTCGILHPTACPGSMMLADSSRFVQQNYNYPQGEPYLLCSKVPANEALCQLLHNELNKTFGIEKVHKGVDLTCETFYNSQGRIDAKFEDFNQDLIDKMIELEPEAVCLEMETFKLFHLAQCSKGNIFPAACMIGLLNRKTQEMIDFSTLPDIERTAATAALKALVQYELGN